MVAFHQKGNDLEKFVADENWTSIEWCEFFLGKNVKVYGDMNLAFQ